jgi:hypothetical protein
MMLSYQVPYEANDFAMPLRAIPESHTQYLLLLLAFPLHCVFLKMPRWNESISYARSV